MSFRSSYGSGLIRWRTTIRESDGGDEVIIYIADTKQMKKLGRNYSVNANNELMEQLLEFLDKENAKIVEKNIEKMC